MIKAVRDTGSTHYVTEAEPQYALCGVRGFVRHLSSDALPAGCSVCRSLQTAYGWPVR